MFRGAVTGKGSSDGDAVIKLNTAVADMNKKLCFHTDYSASIRYLPNCKLKQVCSQLCKHSGAICRVGRKRQLNL